VDPATGEALLERSDPPDSPCFPPQITALEPPLGDGARAAVVHDYLYATRGLEGRYSRAQADGIFREALKALGVPAWKRGLLWAAVRVGGAGGWGR
jgi:hypothetical protein